MCGCSPRFIFFVYYDLCSSSKTMSGGSLSDCVTAPPGDAVRTCMLINSSEYYFYVLR